MSHVEKRVELNKIIESQLPEFLIAEFPKAIEFFKQYYISQENQGGNDDLISNLDRYLKIDNLVPEVVVGKTTLTSAVSDTDTTITVTSTKGFPDDYGLLKIDDEIITYTGKTSTTFTGCIRGFSGITGYETGIQNTISTVNKESVVFSDTEAAAHTNTSTVINLSVLFLQEFYKKLKRTFAPGLEEQTFVEDLDVSTFLKFARNFYQSKGIEESIKILFKVLYGEEAKVLDLETRLIKPSSTDFIRREIVIVEALEGDPFKLEGQALYKSTDKKTIPSVTASVSEVEIFTREGKSYFKLGLFVGYDDQSNIEGVFEIPGFSKVLKTVPVGGTVITVDSTIGFKEAGTITCAGNTITYTSKSINQFFGCSGVTKQIDVLDEVRDDIFVYGYADGDESQIIKVRINGVLSDFVGIDDISRVEVGEEISIQSIGEVIRNNGIDNTYKEIFANSWIYNTSARFNVSDINGSTFTLSTEDIDKSSLKVGDKVDILVGQSQIIASADAEVSSINASNRQIVLNNISGFVGLASVSYTIRRKIETASSSNINLLAGNDVYFSNIQNLYTSDTSDEAYVASLSLPKYEINEEIIESSLPDGSDNNLEDLNVVKKTYSTIKFSSNVKFITGDRIVYTSDNPLAGLESGEKYFVFVSASNKIRLYISRSLIGGSQFVEIAPNTTPSIHRFTLEKHRTRVLSPNNILRKFPLKTPERNAVSDSRGTQGIGILIDGVEISSPDSDDRIYYGPLSDFEVFNGGKDYDVVNPPQIEISAGTGTTALVEPIIEGSVKQVFVDPQDFDVQNIASVSVTGGNGSGCVLQPVMAQRFRELEFDSRPLILGGGIDITDETITFKQQHNLRDFQHLIYNENGNDPITVVEGGTPGTLVSGDEYVAKFVNTSTIKLFKSDSDAISGINTIGLTTTTNASGIHKFRTLSQGTLAKVEVIEPGSGYQHRKLRVKPEGISTDYDRIEFKNHGFKTGDVVNYSCTGTEIVGLSTSDRYSIFALNEDTFKLINVGIAGTVTTDLVRQKFVDIQSKGSGYHIFKYPEIEVNATVSFGSSVTGTFKFTPVITGEITGAYLYESGVGYGSTILNLHKKPLVTLKNGKNAQLNPVISNGRIVEVQVLSGGDEYFSLPELVVTDSNGTGTGAILRPEISNGSIVDVVVINGGLGYDPNFTTIFVKNRGSNAIFNPSVRDLHVNDVERFGKFAKNRTPKIFSNVYENDTQDYLSFSMYGYSTDLAGKLNDTLSNHSPIIGWAYDGNPIYGPFGYKDGTTATGVGIINPGYVLDSTGIFDRPPVTTFAEGFFTEDYRFTNSGDLDVHNGRFCKTPEFPNGVYAYFAGVTTSLTSNTLEPKYPYFVGETFQSKFEKENLILDQTFDFNNSSLVRNTYPYKIAEPEADYDFLDEGYESFSQKSFVTAVSKGSIEQIDVIEGGSGYKVGELVKFDQENTGGTGLSGEVLEVTGKDVLSLSTELERYDNATLIRDNNRQVSAYFRDGFDLDNNDVVYVSGLSTSISNLYGNHNIGIGTENVSLAATMSSYTATPGGITEDIFVSSIPQVSIGNSLTIHSSNGGQEIVRILNNYGNGIIKVQRFASAGVAHTFSSKVNVRQERIAIAARTPEFKSERNSLVYFNAKESVGLGTTSGGAISKTRTVGGIQNTVSIPYQSIYIPNHPFKTGERLTFTMSPKSGVTALISGNDDTNTNTFTVPDQTTRISEVFVISKGADYIGLTTQVGLTTNTAGLFFYSDGTDNDEYLLTTHKTQVTGDVDRIVTTVSTGSSHGLQNKDAISLTVKPNVVVGVGTTAALTLRFNEEHKQLIVNPVGVNSTNINTVTNQITIPNHGFKTGDKVFYESSEVASGLTTGSYYVVEDTRNSFRLAETLYESNPESEKTINIVGTGDTSHTFGLVNPKIDVVRNSDIRFNLNDPSLVGYNLNIYTDQNFVNEFITTYDNTQFNVERSGVVGVAATASLTINYSENIPSILYYGLEKAGYISTSDISVRNYSQINYVNSEYNGRYSVSGVTSTTFKFSPNRLPSVLSYTKDQTDLIEYSTRSETALNSGVAKVKLISGGFNFDKIPVFSEVETVNGRNANIVAISTTIGRVKNFRIQNIDYAYPSDRTLRPEATLPIILNVDDLDIIDRFEIESGGSRYLSAPDLLLYNDTKNVIIDSTSLIADVPNDAVSGIEQIAPIFGIESEPHRVIAINNSNGVGISSILTSASGIATCTINTPINGFTQNLFQDGDEIFVEGIELVSPTGTGYNSEDYGYRFFKIDTANFLANPATIQFSLLDDAGAGLTTNPGIAKTFQSGYATIVNRRDYPDIRAIRKRATFADNEKLFVDSGTGFRSVDLRISMVREDYIKVLGRYNIQKGEKVKGVISGVIATITGVSKDRSKFTIDYSSSQNLGWRDDIGKLSEDFQVTPDNDYYQNLSYSVKSSIPWDTMSGPVNSILHPAGMKNFADVGITSATDTGVSIGGTTNAIIILDVINEERVDTINNFDFTVDDDVRGNQSKFLRIKNRKLTDYTECRTNRVLIHDDISDRFSSKGFQGSSIEIEEIDIVDTNVRYVIQIVAPDSGDVQITELVLQSTTLNSYLLEKNTTFSRNKLGDFSADVETDGRKTLIFTPVDAFDTDLDIKVLKKTFANGFAGIGSQAIASIDLIASNTLGISSVGTATSEKVVYEFNDADFNGAFASFEIADRFNNSNVSFVEAAIDFDGTDVNISEYYFDTNNQSYSATKLGIVTSIYDANAGIVSVSVINNTVNQTYDVRSNFVKFADTAAGDGIYRFLQASQPPGSENSAVLESVVDSGSGSVTIGTYDINRFSSVSSLVRVSSGTQSAIHQVSAVCDSLKVVVTPGMFAATGNTTGLGTFGGQIVGSDFLVKFFPDSGSVEAQAYNQAFYTTSDYDTQPLDLEYGSNVQNILLSGFDSLNGPRANKLFFPLKHDGVPIYAKTFDPSTTTVNLATGEFTINDHFFNTGEELDYIPDSTFVGVGRSHMGIGQTANYLGIVTDRLPEKVYPIVSSPNNFKLATTPQFAALGIAVTFTDVGVGNAHRFEFTKKLTKTVIALDGIVQQPITFTSINHTLEHNSFFAANGITAGISTFNISGISSIQPRDLIRIDDEYMKVVEVGLSTNVGGELLGPINGVISAGFSTFPSVSVVRASVGSTAVAHENGAEVRVYRGSFNIVDSTVHFTDPPKGNTRTRRDASNLPFVSAKFSGRTFLRQDYATNMLFDDISEQFTGIGKTYTMTVGGGNTTGVEAGNGILFLNGVFQTPTTTNNIGNNYEFENDNVAGISSVVFTGITSTDGSFIRSEFDINQNQLPRGGMIVSLGSTPGLGYAPLVGAKVKADLTNGAITDVVGVNTYRNPVGIATAAYNKSTGVIELRTHTNHYLKGGDRVQLVGLHFTCTPAYSGVTTTIFPDHDRSFDVVNILSANELTVQVGTSTITHNYVGFGEVFKHYSLNHGSGYRDPVAIGVTDIAFDHKFVRAGVGSIFVGSAGTTSFTATGADFESHTGKLIVTVANHGLQVGNQVGFDTGGLILSCSEDNFLTEQPYPRSTDPVAGITTEVTTTTTNTFTVNVGPAGGAGTGAVVSAVVGAGGTLAFNIDNAGSGYVNPRITIEEPIYENMSVIGVSRLGQGATTETGENLLLNLKVGAASTNVGIGSTLFQVESFEVARTGYNFKVGDVMKVVGLVTAAHLTSPVSDFELEVVETFNDRMSSWSFGEMDYIDTTALLQNGVRKRFPLFYNGQLLSFEIDPNHPLSSQIDLNAVLLIFINGVLQQPETAYQFEGGTSVTFTQAPNESDKVDIFFYIGQEGVDVTIVNITETIKIGDDLFVKKMPGFSVPKDQSRDRTIVDITGSDTVETDIYVGPGINDTVFRPLDWNKQKVDKFVKGDVVSKTRPVLEPRVYPTARIIGDLNTSSTNIFVDNAKFFNYEEDNYGINITNVDALVVDSNDPVSAAFTATVSAGGTISAVTITNPGLGYSGTFPIKFANPVAIGVGVGTTAIAEATADGHSIVSVNITNPGFGYTNTNPPNMIIEVPEVTKESIVDIQNVQGFSGIITGIAAVNGIGGHPLALRINFRTLDVSDANDLSQGYPVMIYNTTVGTGVTSVDGEDASVIGIGTQFLDNVYKVHQVSNNGPDGQIICNIDSNTNVVGIATTGSAVAPILSLGNISWGRIYDYNARTNPISIGVTGLTVDAGLSTFPTIQRRDFGFRDSGALRDRSVLP